MTEPQVLVIEDQGDWADTIKRVLAQEMCNIVCVTDLQEAQRNLTRDDIEFDVVITNMVLGGGVHNAEGLAVVKKVQAFKGRVQCIVLSWSSDFKVAQTFINLYDDVVCGIMEKSEVWLEEEQFVAIFRKAVARAWQNRLGSPPPQAPPPPAPRYNQAAIRKLLLNAFIGAEDLRMFCDDRPPFHPILAYFGPEQGFNTMVNHVIRYCGTKLLFAELLKEVAAYNPERYKQYESEIFE